MSDIKTYRIVRGLRLWRHNNNEHIQPLFRRTTRTPRPPAAPVCSGEPSPCIPQPAGTIRGQSAWLVHCRAANSTHHDPLIGMAPLSRGWKHSLDGSKLTEPTTGSLLSTGDTPLYTLLVPVQNNQSLSVYNQQLFHYSQCLGLGHTPIRVGMFLNAPRRPMHVQRIDYAASLKLYTRLPQDIDLLATPKARQPMATG